VSPKYPLTIPPFTFGIQEEHIRPIAALINQLRDLELVQKAADTPPPPANPILGGVTVSGVPNAWDHTARYAPEDHVVFQDEVYKCIAAHLSHPRLSPLDTPQLWSLIPNTAVITDKALLLTLNVNPTPWKERVNYDIGVRVIFKGMIYMCIQAHRSQSDWTPDITLSLWKPLEAAPPEPPQVEPPLYRRRSLLLPIEVNLQPVIATPVNDRKKADEDRRKAAQDAEKEAIDLLKTYEDLKLAISELVKLNPNLLELAAQPTRPAIDVEDKFGKVKGVQEQQEYRRQLRDIALGKAKAQLLPETWQTVTAVADPTDPPAPVPAEPTGAYNLAKDLLSTAGLLHPKGSWSPIPPEDRTPRLKSSALASLSETTKNVLNDPSRGIDITKQSLNRVFVLLTFLKFISDNLATTDIIQRLRLELDGILGALKALAPTGDNTSYTRMGAGFITTRSPILSRVTALLYGHQVSKSATALPVLPLDGRVPHTKGNVSSVGMADLLVVRQTLTGYEGADVAHIENVLKGENHQRTNTQTTRTETTVSVETEKTTTEEHELTSTSRFEMSKEVENTLDEDQSLKADLKVSAKYGPVVSVDASAEGSISRKKQEVTKAASKFSQDVVERTVKKITEKVSEKRTTTTIVSLVC